MQLLVNGKPTEIQKPNSLDQILKELGYQDSFFVVALNANCIPKSQYSTTSVQNNDELEIVAPQAGG